MAGSDPPRSKSQKRQSQSRPREECDPKKGRTEENGRPNRVQVGIDWSNTGIQKPAPKPDSQHLSSKPDSSKGGNEQQPRMKSVVLKEPLKQSSSHSIPPRFRESPAGSDGKTTSKNSGSNHPKKIELKEKPYNYIAECIHRSDPQGYMEEIQSFQHFRNLKDFALKIIVIADWGRKYHSVGLQFPIPPSLTTCLTILPSHNKRVDKFPPNPITCSSLEAMSEESALSSLNRIDFPTSRKVDAVDPFG